ncbi:hypothetical protein ACJIZ3_008028 [Penstemon smallii]|uniref:Protein kinase domain-containing protein n=1 Tax=Penstemon smallii TaxID=265156 RepID=A0ABD3T8Y8_9LAMI
MAELQYQKIIIFTLLFHFSSFFFYSSAYNLPERYFVNCGSSSSPIVYGRTFTGDQNSRNFAVSSGHNHPVEDDTNLSSIELYQSARIFRKNSSYELDILENGTYVVRFHFFHFSSMGNLSDARFGVIASGFSLLSNFSVQKSNFALIEELLLEIPLGKFRIDFVLYDEKSFAFVNAIEVFLAPPEFISNVHDVSGGTEISYHNVFSSVPLQVIHRINVGGDNIMPNNDTLLRYWIPDDAYIFNNNTAKKSDFFNDKPKYQLGGATEFNAPDFVYKTAKEMNIVDNTSGVDNKFNISWRFEVKKGVQHFVRVHFCDIVSSTPNENFKFSLYIYSTFSQMIWPFDHYPQTGAPFYYDFVVDSDDSGFLIISVGSQSVSSVRTAFLNGVEIMQLVKEKSSVERGNDLTKKRFLIIIGSSIGGLVLVLIILSLGLFFCLKKRKKPVEAIDWPLAPLYGGSSYSRTTDKTSIGSPLLDLNLGLKVPFAEILRATKNFNTKLKIGEGGFGKVYKGILRNGTKVAVKRSDPGHGQGLPEFHTEITILSKIRHNNLVSLIGYCDERDEMILVYEFMEKGTLRDHLYYLKEECNESSSRSELSWNQRVEICIGAAKGIHYLHTGSNGAIIHRDIKSTNILLDEHYVAKVADFGLSRSGILDQTHVSTEVKGSFGYLDPEYFRCLQLTQKSDVYSFGVVLLEVLCARPAIDHTLPRDQINLADWGVSWQMKGELEKIVDPFLVGKINPNSLRKFGETMEKCLQENGVDRPNMVDVLWDLEYTLQLQHTVAPREPYEDSTTEVSWNLPMPHSIHVGEDDENYSFSNASQVNATEIFSQLKIDEAR